jgi:hypothetical protein
MGVTSACFHIVGRMPCRRVLLKINSSGTAINAENDFKNLVEILSGPVADLSFILFITFSISDLVNRNEPSESLDLGGSKARARGVPLSTVKTELN